MLIAFINFKPYHGSKFKLKASRTICEELHEVIIESIINVWGLCDPLFSLSSQIKFSFSGTVFRTHKGNMKTVISFLSLVKLLLN